MSSTFCTECCQLTVLSVSCLGTWFALLIVDNEILNFLSPHAWHGLLLRLRKMVENPYHGRVTHADITFFSPLQLWARVLAQRNHCWAIITGSPPALLVTCVIRHGGWSRSGSHKKRLFRKSSQIKLKSPHTLLCMCWWWCISSTGSLVEPFLAVLWSYGSAMSNNAGGLQVAG